MPINILYYIFLNKNDTFNLLVVVGARRLATLRLATTSVCPYVRPN